MEERLTYHYQTQVDTLTSKVDALTAVAKRMENSISITKEDYMSLLATIETLEAKLNKLQQDENRDIRDLKHFTLDDISSVEKKIYASMTEHANISDDKNAALLQLIQNTEHDLRADLRKAQKMILATEKSCISRAAEEISSLRTDFYSERENHQAQMLELKSVLAAEISARRKVQGKHDNDMKTVISQVEHNLSKFQSFTSENNASLAALDDKLTHSAFTFAEQLLTLQKNIKSALYVLKNKTKELQSSIDSNVKVANQKHLDLSAQLQVSTKRVSAIESELASLSSRLIAELESVNTRHAQSSDSTSQLAHKLQILQEKDVALGAEIKMLESSLTLQITEKTNNLSHHIDSIATRTQADVDAIKENLSSNIIPQISTAHDDIAATRTLAKTNCVDLERSLRGQLSTEVAALKNNLALMTESLPPQITNEVNAREAADIALTRRLESIQADFASKWSAWSQQLESVTATQTSASHVAVSDMTQLKSELRENRANIDKLSTALHEVQYELQKLLSRPPPSAQKVVAAPSENVINLEVAYTLDRMVSQIVDKDVNMCLNVLESRISNVVASSTTSLSSLEQSSIHDLPRFMSYVKSKLKKEALSREQSHSAIHQTIMSGVNTSSANPAMDKLAVQVLELQERIADYKAAFEELQQRVTMMEDDSTVRRDVQTTLNSLVGLVAESELVELVDQNSSDLLTTIEEMQRNEKCVLLQQINQLSSFLEEIQKRQLVMDNRLKEIDKMNMSSHASVSSEV